MIKIHVSMPSNCMAKDNVSIDVEEDLGIPKENWDMMLDCDQHREIVDYVIDTEMVIINWNEED